MSTMKQAEDGFTIVELLVSLTLLSVLLLVAGLVFTTAATTNAKTNLNSLAGEQAFKKLQDYINTTYDNVPIGLVGSQYEVEDFSNDTSLSSLKNAEAKVYVEPASIVNSNSSTTTTDYSKSSAADTSVSAGSEISASGTLDPTNCCRRDYRLIDNSYYNLVYNNYEPGSSNQPLPAIDLGASTNVSTIRINWYASPYVSQNFRIEGSNNGTSWTTVASGLSTNSAVGSSVGNYPEDYSVSGSYRYWRMFNITGTNSTWLALSEFEAYSAGSGDVVEQAGSDASSNPGELNFSSTDLTMSENGTSGHQSIGLRFKGIDVNQGTAITNAYVQFTASNTDSAAVQLIATGVDTNDAVGWAGNYAVDNAVSGTNGTSATSTWNPSSWTSGLATANERVTVTGIVQEILNRAGWANGNSMGIAIQYVSGNGKRIAAKASAPVLVIEWSETVTVNNGGAYVDNNGDGDADNPSLLKVKTIISYDSFGERREIEYTSYIRKYGLGG